MHKQSHIIYFTLIFIVFILIVLAFMFTPQMPMNSYSSGYIEPISIHQSGEYEREFIFDVNNLDSDKTDIAFFTKHQYVKIYSDHKLIYEYTENGGIWGHTNGAFWSFVDIPYGTSELEINLTAAYDNVKNDVPTFLIGDKLDIFQDIYKIPFRLC